jgi:hypothetical protein
MTPDRPPDTLQAEIQRTLRPVAPLASPSRRALVALGWGAVLLVAVPAIWGLRGDRAALGAWRLWGPSALQMAVAFGIAALALLESLPGRRPPRQTMAGVALAAVAVFVATTAISYAASATFVPVRFASRYFWICFTHPLALGVPGLLVVWAMARRGLLTQPTAAGALCGLSAGLLSDASWRLYCHVSDPAHVLVAHAGSIAGLTALGMLAGTVRTIRAPRG